MIEQPQETQKVTKKTEWEVSREVLPPFCVSLCFLWLLSLGCGHRPRWVLCVLCSESFFCLFCDFAVLLL